MTAQESLEPLVAAVDGLNMQFTPDTLTGGLVEAFMADAHCRRARRIAGAAIGDQQSIWIENRLQNCLQMSARHPRQYGTDGGARALACLQDRNLRVRHASFGGLTAPLLGLSIQVSFTFTAAQNESLIGFDDAA